jgi:histidine triad (HIT) family protein
MVLLFMDELKDDCIFCKIIKKDVPCYKIYENEYVLAFLDAFPTFKGHTLVVSKKHFVNVFDCEDKYLEEISKALKLISNHYVSVLGCQGVNIMNASGECAQQSVFHLHFHIAPRFEGDGLIIWPSTDYEKGDLKALSSKLSLV